MPKEAEMPAPTAPGTGGVVLRLVVVLHLDRNTLRVL